MKSKQEIRDWILQNCIDKFGIVDLSELDFTGYRVYINEMKADFIWQGEHEAKYIYQKRHKTKEIREGEHFIIKAELEESPTTPLVELEKILESRVKEDYRLADIWFKKNESVAKMILRENEVIKYVLMLINHLKEETK